jgi:hypothetical protein
LLIAVKISLAEEHSPTPLSGFRYRVPLSVEIPDQINFYILNSTAEHSTLILDDCDKVALSI